jgi:hypothetical protein
MYRFTFTAAAICAALVVSSMPARAQQFNVFAGAGTASDDSSRQAIDAFGNGNFINTPKLGGLFLNVGGEFMFTNHFGAGAEINWRAGQGDYVGLNYWPIFYDFNGIWQPIKAKRFVPELQAGVGGVAVNFNANTTLCDQFAGCNNFNLGSERSKHFQTHLGVAARIYATPHIFIRPAVDAHYVNNFFQFGSNWVPEYTIGIGYSLGGEQ